MFEQHTLGFQVARADHAIDRHTAARRNRDAQDLSLAERLGAGEAVDGDQLVNTEVIFLCQAFEGIAGLDLVDDEFLGRGGAGDLRALGSRLQPAQWAQKPDR